MGRAGQQIPRVVIEPVQDLHIAAAEKPRVGEVRLPHLVGLAGFEAGVGTAGPFARLGDDQPRPMQDPPDRGASTGPAAPPVPDATRSSPAPHRARQRSAARAARSPASQTSTEVRRSVRPRAARAGLERVQTSFPIGRPEDDGDAGGRTRTRQRQRSPTAAGRRPGEQQRELETSPPTPHPRPRPAIAASASPSGLRLRDDRRQPASPWVRPMSRLMRDISPGTYVVNPDTPLSACDVSGHVSHMSRVTRSQF